MKLPGRRSATARTPSAKSAVLRSRLLHELVVGLRLDRRRQVGAERGAGRLHGQRRVLGDLARQPQRGAAQLVQRHELVDQAPGQRLARR